MASNVKSFIRELTEYCSRIGRPYKIEYAKDTSYTILDWDEESREDVEYQSKYKVIVPIAEEEAIDYIGSQSGVIDRYRWYINIASSIGQDYIYDVGQVRQQIHNDIPLIILDIYYTDGETRITPLPMSEKLKYILESSAQKIKVVINNLESDMQNLDDIFLGSMANFLEYLKAFSNKVSENAPMNALPTNAGEIMGITEDAIKAMMVGSTTKIYESLSNLLSEIDLALESS